MSSTESVDAEPDAGNLLSDGELEEVMLFGRGVPLQDVECTPVHELVRSVTRADPSAIAVLGNGNTLSYGELDEWADRIAVRLDAVGVRKGDHVGILAEPSTATVASALAVLRRGAVYVPVDREQPERQTSEFFANARVVAVITADAQAPKVSALGFPVVRSDQTPQDTDELPRPSDQPPVAVGRTDPAYIIHTSGSTGDPKGILVEHGQLAASTLARRRVYPGTPVHLLLAPIAFDSSAAGLWGTLTTGGRLVIPTFDEVRDPGRLVDLIQTHQVTQMLCVPSLYDVVLDAAERVGTQRLASLRTVIVAGETLSEALVKRHFDVLPGSVELVNEYGPTETTVWASYHRFDAPGPVSIGGPAPGVRLYVLDDELRPVRPGVRGELVIGGAGVSRGYIGRPDATGRAFLPDPFAGTQGARMYRTGDLVRWDRSGRLDFLGRRDHQVKIRGHRTELGAVEAAMRTAPGVRDAVVVTDAERTRLIGFALAHQGATAESVREHLTSRLPAFMVPASVAVLDDFPRTVNGKVDRGALAAAVSTGEPASSATAARPAVRGEDLEQRVAAAWAEILRLPDIPREVNFFDLGGHSLAMFRLQDALEQHTGVRPSVAMLFRCTTVSAQAAMIGAGEGQGDAVPGEQRQESRRARALNARRQRLRQPVSVAPQPRKWLQCVVPREEPRQRLICFPHAGGSASFFRDWGRHLSDIEVHAVCYPGRGERIEEPPATDLRALATQIAEAVASLGGAEIALFGHSMGAVVAFEAARALEAGGIRPTHLFASGSRETPGGFTGSDAADEWADGPADNVVNRLVDLGGTDPELAADPAFQELVLPYVEADSQMFHNYILRPDPILHCPVTALVGDCDPHADIRPWSELTEGQFREEPVSGDHFYLVPNPPFALLEKSLST
ncbi:amino acid adenylation domain-containing protein [Streptomyces sp. NPDC094034]|uniref:amino acid adenylation domain-containing protein n=1 Tax=Streptomyces sp. NPDC094034 TaxID=3155309 RepID=UPI00331EA2E0